MMPQEKTAQVYAFPKARDFYLFAGDTFYPGGGWHDFKGVFPSIQMAQAEGAKYDWFHVVEIVGKVIGTSGVLPRLGTNENG